MTQDKLTPALSEIVENFQLCQGNEKLEYLLELAESLRPLPAALAARLGDLDEVNECMTPVHLAAEKDGHGGLTLHFDVPPESPTVRGFAAILQQGLEGATVEEVLAVPNEFYLATGLQSVLSGQRMNGMSAMLVHLKRLAAAA